ncbi:MAG: ABC transporter transmembrane domain-containing protein, partial [Solirubrobacteraceae bacterium]|nr:ABC transporter transmembrane domain-containing protein [Solirubrobacteraceae bacterium]
MWHYARGARGWLLLSSAMLVASQLLKLAVPWFSAQAIDLLQKSATGGANLSRCLPWVGGIVGLYALSWAMHGPGRVIERTVALRVRRALADELYGRLAGAPLAWHGTHHPAELAHRMTQATQALSNFTQSQFIYLQNAVSLVGPIVALMLLSATTGSVAIGGMVVVAATIVAFDRALMRHARVENDAERRHGATLIDCLSNVLTVLSLRLQGTTRRLLMKRLQAVEAPLVRNITLAEWKWCAVDLLSISLTWGLVALYAWRSSAAGAQGGLMLGGIFMVYQYAQQSSGVIGSLAGNLQNFARIRTDYASAAPIWAAPLAARETREQALPANWRHIDLCDLACAYPADGEH